MWLGALARLIPRHWMLRCSAGRQRGTWSDLWQGILELDAEFLDTYREFSMVPWRKNHLDAKTKELIYIALDANATHMYLPGVRQHIKAALKLGATAPEIMEVLPCPAGREPRASGRP